MNEEEKNIEENNNDIVEESIEEETTDNIEKIEEEPKENIQPKEEKPIKAIIKQFGAILLYALICFITVKLTTNGGLDVIEEIIHKEKNKENYKFSIVDIKSKSEGNYIDSTETFIITTENGTKEDLQKHLYIEPALNYTIEQNKKNEYSVTVNDIPSNTLVNLNYVNNEIVDYKWAFQSTKDLQVTSTYPIDGASEISTYTTIEITLSYADVKNISKYFHISPEVNGKFEHIGRTWRFTPDTPLKPNTTYTIVVDKGYTNGEYTAEEAYKSSFATYTINTTSNENDERLGKYYSSITQDKINTFLPTEKPIFRLNSYYNYKPAHVSLSKFKNLDNFLSFLDNDLEFDITDLGEVSFQSIYKNAYVIDKTLEPGYYLENVTLSDNKTSFSIPIQVNELSAYALATNNDILVWVGSGDKLLEDINVKYNDNTIKTNKDGIAIVKNYSDRSKKLNYVYVGDKNPLVVGVYNEDEIEYPEGFIYTDRPLYKNTDTINVWGYVPIKYFNEKFEEKNLSLTFNEKNIPITLSNDGTFTTKIELNNLKDSYYCLDLTYKNKYVSSNCVDVNNYEKQNYEYIVDYDKNILAPGEKFEFDVTVNHITGIKVPNKTIVVSYEDKEYTAVTNDFGVASFSITPKTRDNNYSNMETHSVSIKTANAEYDNNYTWVNFTIITKNVGVEEYPSHNIKDDTINAKIININPKKKKIIDNHSGYDTIKELKESNYNGPITIRIEENKSTRYISGYSYNQYTKENEPIYRYNHSDLTIKTETVNIENGVLNYKLDIERKESNENDTYYYYAYLTIKDNNGKTLEQSVYINSNEGSTDYKNGYLDYGGASKVNDEDYHIYRYYLAKEDKKYSIDDKMEFALMDYTNKAINDSTNFLEIKFKDSILDTKIYNKTDDVNNIFTENDVPGIKLTAAFFNDGHFYRLPSNYYDFNEEDRKVNIDIKTDKKNYKPQETVNVTINAKDKNKNNLKTKLIVSVVDEKIFNSVADYTQILDNVYRDMYYSSYTYSTFRDYELYFDEGGQGGTDGGIRADFGDTILFKEVETDANGNANLSFKLNDSITSFRITVLAANKDVYVGDNKANINSRLPLAIEFTTPRGLKETDDVVLNAYSTGTTEEKVEYEFAIKGNNNKINKTASIGETVYANFGKLPIGTYEVNISAKSGNNKDKVAYNFEVTKSRKEINKKSTSNVTDLKELKIKKNPITLEFYRESFKNNLKYINILKETNEDRLDTLVAYYKALEAENKYYKTDSAVQNIDIKRFKLNDFLTYLNGEGISNELTAFVTYYDPSLYKADLAIVEERLINATSLTQALDYYLILASLKQPVLDDIKFLEEKYIDTLDDKYKAIISLTYAFLGDYNSAKRIYDELNTQIIDQGLVALLSTFIDKTNAQELIDNVYENDYANRYVFFALISYLENNSLDIAKEESLTVKYNNTKEDIVLNGLTIKRLVINDNDLKSLKIDTKYEDIMVDYYYEGELDKDDNVVEDIKLSLSKTNIKRFDTIDLNVDISKIKTSGIIKVFLPNSLRLSSTNTNQKGIYLSSNKIDYLQFYIGKDHEGTIRIPLYVTTPGNYQIEEVIIKINDEYHISNTLDLTIQE